MTDTLTPYQFELAIGYMIQHPVQVAPDEFLPSRLPYGYFPGQITGGGLVSLNTRDAWDKYVWNPPEHDHDHPDSQPDCAPKPTWDTLVEYATAALRAQAVDRLRQACSARITQDAFGEATLDDERNKRLRALEFGADLADQIKTMHTLRARYKAIKAWLEAVTDIEALAGLDFSAPEFWTPTWTPPDLQV